MKIVSKKVAIDVKSLTLLMVSVLMICVSFITLRGSYAAATPLSGICGGVFSLKTSSEGVLPANDDAAVNAGTYINFNNNTISFALTELINGPMVNGAYDSSWAQKSFANKSFSIVADPQLADAFQLTIPADGQLSTTIVVRLIPVNSGSTILIQGKSLGATGMCQKV
jgi:hypothetical protein